MSLYDEFYFTDSDRSKGVEELPDRPRMSPEELKSWFDKAATDVIMPRINDVLKHMDTSSFSHDIRINYGGDDMSLHQAIDKLRTDLDSAVLGSIEFPSGGIKTNDLQDDCVTSDKIASGAVGSSELAGGCILASHMAAWCVSTPAISDGAVTESKLAENSVGLDKLADDLVVPKAEWAETYGNVALYTLQTVFKSGELYASLPETVFEYGDCSGLLTSSVSDESRFCVNLTGRYVVDISLVLLDEDPDSVSGTGEVDVMFMHLSADVFSYHTRRCLAFKNASTQLRLFVPGMIITNGDTFYIKVDGNGYAYTVSPQSSIMFQKIL